MFDFIFNLVALGVTLAAGIFMFGAARQFVRSKLRFVDGVYNPVVPWAVGAVAIAVGMVVAGILPIIGAGAGIVVGAMTGLGTASGVKALKRGE